MDLFSSASDSHEPLAYRMRPRTIDEYIGQEHILGKGRLLRRIIQADQLSSLIFFGPPGTGKTTLARVIANTTKSYFITMNAVLSGVKELRESIEEAKKQRDLYGRRTILFVDEVHRWNRAQQDALLPWVENGTVVLIGATTQNPYFEVNSALVSRSRIFQLKALTEEDLGRVVDSALRDKERGYGNFSVSIDEDARSHLVRIANGDARSLLNALELAVETTPESFPPPPGTPVRVTLSIAEESIQRKVVLYDKEGDYHFDIISAFIKSLRGSDPDAALYWLAKMVHAGEDPNFIFRRMLILACEDVGLADPHALSVIHAAAESFDRVGLPEGRFHLAHAALYLATAPKSNSALGFFDALDYVSNERDEDVPAHLRDSSRDKEGFGHGEGYLYPHAFRDHWVAQAYLPQALKGRVFYNPGEVGYEAGVRDQVFRRREEQIESSFEEAGLEVLTFSPKDRDRDRWISRLSDTRSSMLKDMRSRVIGGAGIRRHDRVLDVNAGRGLILWEAFRMAPEGCTWGLAPAQEDREVLLHYAERFREEERPVIMGEDIESFRIPEENAGLQFDVIVGRNLFTRRPDKGLICGRLFELLSGEGRLSLVEVVPSKAQRLSAFIPDGSLSEEEIAAWKKAEESVYSDPTNPLVNWNEETLKALLSAAGFSGVSFLSVSYREVRVPGERECSSWFDVNREGYGSVILRELGSELFEKGRKILTSRLSGAEVDWLSTVCYLSGSGGLFSSSGLTKIS